ncbi:MAG: tyrosine-type recombinase/integrase [Solirubrobacteraceae bacterium]
MPDHLIPELLCGLGHGPKQRAAKGGVDRRVHAHGLRHTHAAELAREGTPINIIRDDLGHTSLAVTDRYLRDVAPQAVIDTLRARRWGDA